MPTEKRCFSHQVKKMMEKAAKEYIHSIANAIREKVAAIITNNNFFSILSDGSQARKVKTDKEMIMVRMEKSGVPSYFVVSLAEMSRYGLFI